MFTKDKKNRCAYHFIAPARLAPLRTGREGLVVLYCHSLLTQIMMPSLGAISEMASLSVLSGETMLISA